MPDLKPQRPSLPQALLPFAMAGLGVAMASQMVARDARYWLPVLTLMAFLVVPGVVGRLRMRRLLISGDVKRLLESAQMALGAEPQGTMVSLARATAYAAYGWTDAARRALHRASPGPVWEAAIEQRMFVEALLAAFEGDRQGAMIKAAELEALPVSAAGPFARRRIHVLRRGLAALTRAFGHVSRGGDPRLLAKAAKTSPLVHWAMRYAAAIVAVDRGRLRDVAGLLSGAPAWPEESAFREYHDELLVRAGLAVP